MENEYEDEHNTVSFRISMSGLFLIALIAFIVIIERGEEKNPEVCEPCPLRADTVLSEN